MLALNSRNNSASLVATKNARTPKARLPLGYVPNVQIVQYVQVVQRTHIGSDGLNDLNGLNYLNRLRAAFYVLLALKVFAACANFSVVRNPPRRGFTRAKSPRRQVRKLLVFTFAPLRLCARYSDSFGCGFAALGSLWLDRTSIASLGTVR